MEWWQWFILIGIACFLLRQADKYFERLEDRLSQIEHDLSTLQHDLSTVVDILVDNNFSSGSYEADGSEDPSRTAQEP